MSPGLSASSVFITAWKNPPPILSHIKHPNQNNQHQKCQCWVQEEGEDEDGRDLTLKSPFSLPQNQQTQQQKQQNDDDDVDKAEEQEEGEDENGAQGCGRGNWTIVLSSRLVGLLTGIGVVLFNYSVHEIHDMFWGGMPQRGAPWLREKFMGDTWKQVILVPASRGLIIAILNLLQDAFKDGPQDKNGNEQGGEKGENLLVKMGIPVLLFDGLKAVSCPFLKAITACVTLGTGNLLGPEGPSVEIGTSIAKGIGALFDKSFQRRLSLVAAGSAAGIASELPLYLLLAVACGLVSLTLSKCTSYMLVFVDSLHKIVGPPKFVFPIVGGLAVRLMALAYPEILYRGFENVDILLDSRPLEKGLSADLLLQLVVIKIGATSLCRASGLVGGYYAPSLYIGAAT